MRPSVHCELINGPFGDPVVYADIMFARRSFLFDIGDISALTARKLLRVSHVFVTHTHLDHFAGFDRLLRVALGRDRTIALYGPAGFISHTEHKLHAYTWNVVRRYAENLVFEVFEVWPDAIVRRARFESREEFRREDVPDAQMTDGVLASCEGLVVCCAILDHGTPCLGFALQEPAHVNIWKTQLDERDMVVGPWLHELKRAILERAPDETPIPALQRTDRGVSAVSLPLGTLRPVAQVVAGQKMAYFVDVRYHDVNAGRIERLALDADVMFIECAFLEADAAHASRKSHLTARQAGVLARRARVKRIVPFHFSTRYTGRGAELVDEARCAFDAPATH